MSDRTKRLESLSRRTMNHGSFKSAATVLAVGAMFCGLSSLACSKDTVAQAAPAEARSDIAAQGESAGEIKEGPQPYTIETATVGDCKVGAECVATIKITASGEYHVNETYPFRFTAGAVDGVEYHGSSGNVFAGGDFARQGKTAGVMTVKFKPSKAGSVTIAGPYKICICTEKVCQPSSVNVSFTVAIK